jgi:ethanolamine utilization protein EutN
MRTGTVTGSVWATRRLDGLPPGAFLTIDLDGGGELIAFDVLGAGVGERVLIAQGLSAARRFTAAAAIDALVIGSLDTQPAATADGDHQKGNSHV